MEIKFTGLNECVAALTDTINYDSKEAKDLALKIVNIMKAKTQEFEKKYTFNFLLAGNENETIDKEFLEFDRVIFGKVKNVTDNIAHHLKYQMKQI